MRRRIQLAIIAIVSLFATTVVPPQPASADAAVLKTTVALAASSTPVVLNGLSGQSSCTVELSSAVTGTLEGIEQGVPVQVKAVQIPDGGAPSATVTGPGQFTANCAGMQVFEFVPTGAVTTSVTIIASGAVGRIIGAGVNGGATTVVGSGPITVTTTGGTSTIGLTAPLTIPQGGTNATSLPSGCLQSNGTVVSSTGIACGGSGGVTAVTGTGNIAVTAGATPVVSITNAPTYTGTATNGNVIDSGLTASTCVGANGSKQLTSSMNCVASVSGDGANISSTGGSTPTVSLTNSPTLTGTITASTIVGNSTSQGDFYASGPDNLAGEQGFSATFSGGAINAPNSFVWSNTQGSSRTTLGSDSTASIGGTTGKCGVIALSNGANPPARTTALQTWDCTGNSAVNGTLTATTFSGSGSGLTSGTVPNASLVTAPVTSVTGTGNISSTGGTTPVVSITAAPSFSSITDTGAGASRCLYTNPSSTISGVPEPCPVNITSASFTVPSVGASVSVSVTDTLFITKNNTPILITDGTNTMTGLATAGAGTTTLTVTNTGMAAGAVGNTMATSAYMAVGSDGVTPVTSVTGTGNISVTAGQTPVVSITAAPTFSQVTDSALLSQRCVRSGGSGILNSSDQECPITITGGSFVIPAVGSTVSVAINTTNAVAKNNTPVTINDGTNSMNGVVTSGAASSTYTVRNTGMIAGAVGNTMASSAVLNVANANQDFDIQGGTRANGLHVESSAAAGISVGTATTATFTYGTAFTAAPTCTVSTVGALAPTMSLNAPPGTSSAVIYNSGTSGTASITCIGW